MSRNGPWHLRLHGCRLGQPLCCMPWLWACLYRLGRGCCLHGLWCSLHGLLLVHQRRRCLLRLLSCHHLLCRPLHRLRLLWLLWRGLHGACMLRHGLLGWCLCSLLRVVPHGCLLLLLLLHHGMWVGLLLLLLWLHWLLLHHRSLLVLGVHGLVCCLHMHGLLHVVCCLLLVVRLMKVMWGHVPLVALRLQSWLSRIVAPLPCLGRLAWLQVLLHLRLLVVLISLLLWLHHVLLLLLLLLLHQVLLLMSWMLLLHHLMVVLLLWLGHGHHLLLVSMLLLHHVLLLLLLLLCSHLLLLYSHLLLLMLLLMLLPLELSLGLSQDLEHHFLGVDSHEAHQCSTPVLGRLHVDGEQPR